MVYLSIAFTWALFTWACWHCLYLSMIYITSAWNLICILYVWSQGPSGVQENKEQQDATEVKEESDTEIEDDDLAQNRVDLFGEVAEAEGVPDQEKVEEAEEQKEEAAEDTLGDDLQEPQGVKEDAEVKIEQDEYLVEQQESAEEEEPEVEVPKQKKKKSSEKDREKSREKGKKKKHRRRSSSRKRSIGRDQEDFVGNGRLLWS